MSHHTKEEAAAAFRAAHIVLTELEAAGAAGSYFELHIDGSAALILNSNTPKDAFALAIELLHSERVRGHSEFQVSIASCCGLVALAKERGLL